MESNNIGLKVIDFSQKESSNIFQESRRNIEQYGAFIAKNLVNMEVLKEIRRYISKIISLQRGDASSPVSDDELFDDKFAELVSRDRELGGVIYRACRRLAPLHVLSVDPNLIELSKYLMNTEFISCTNLKAIRIDYPGDDQKFLFDLHQDYPYIMDSQNALVYWFPLRNVNEKLGPLRIYPETHKLGLQKVRSIDPDNKNKNGAKSIEISNIDKLKSLPHVKAEINFGDCVIFSTLILHQSSRNISDYFRWTVQVRHGDFTYEDAIKRKWPGGMIEGEKFHEVHPEYIEEK